MNQGKHYVIDGSLVMLEPECFEVLGQSGNTVHVPAPVLQDLSRLASPGRTTDFNVRFLAQQALRTIEEYNQGGSLIAKEGVSTKSGGKLRIEVSAANPKTLPNGFRPDDIENQILLVAMKMTFDQRSRNGAGRPVILVTNNPSLRLRAAACDVAAEDFRNGRIDDVRAVIFGCVADLSIEQDTVGILRLLHENRLQLSDLSGAVLPGKLDALYDNQCLFLREPNGKWGQGIVKKAEGRIARVRRWQDYTIERDGVQLRNEMQGFFSGLLDDESIRILTVAGPGGGGKTLLTMNWALRNLKGFAKNGSYPKITVLRANVEAGPTLGLRKGSLEQKIDPLRRAIYTAVNTLTGNRERAKGDGNYAERSESNSVWDHLVEKGLLEVTVSNFLRGDNLEGIIILDDAQNLTMGLLLTICSRAALGSRVIITGDPTQIDQSREQPLLDPANCGLVMAMERFRNSKISGSIYLPDIVRSDVAAFVAERLSDASDDFWKS